MLKFLQKTKLWIMAIPLAISLLGAASNQAVLIANHDSFPVRRNMGEVLERFRKDPELEAYNMRLQMVIPGHPIMTDRVHCVMTPSTHLNWLADNFDLGGTIYSIGDFGLEFGDWLFGYAPLVWGILVIKKLKDE